MTGPVRAVVVGFGLTNLYLLAVTGPLVSPQHELVFHLPGSAATLFLAVLLDLFVVWAVLATALWLVDAHPRAELLLWSGLLLALPSGLIATVYGFSGLSVPPGLGWSVALAAVAVFVVANLLAKRILPHLQRIRSTLSLGFSFLVLPELLLCLQLLWYGWEARDLNPPFRPAIPVSRQPTNPAAHAGPTVWIILDELSFDQLYGRRYPGLALPNFDRLSEQALVFTQAVPTAEYTRRAIPSLFTGQPVRQAIPSANGRRLTLVNGRTGHHAQFDPQDTVFSDARRLGLSTEVAGWYEPYCRLLPGVLDQCFWTYSDELPGGLTTEGSLLKRSVEPFWHLIHISLQAAGTGSALPSQGALDVRRHLRDYKDLLAASDRLLQSKPSGLLFLHMPIPHPWGFYDRRDHSFPDHRTSYLDNLALADLYIGQVRAELESQGLWNDTTLLVMGDHSWRTRAVWEGSAHWTAEEQAASHGGAFDDRPAVVLKLPGQTVGSRENSRFDTLRTRALLDALMAHQIATTDQLQGWVQSDPVTHQP